VLPQRHDDDLARGAVVPAHEHERAVEQVVDVCRHDRAAGEVIVVTLWEHEGGPAEPRVPRRFTDALRDKPPRSPR